VEVTEDGTLTISLATDLEPGPHRIVLVVDEVPDSKERREGLCFPVHDLGPWPEGLSLRREDMYDEWGR